MCHEHGKRREFCDGHSILDWRAQPMRYEIGRTHDVHAMSAVDLNL
jgi:hypothetical protein